MAKYGIYKNGILASKKFDTENEALEKLAVLHNGLSKTVAVNASPILDEAFATEEDIYEIFSDEEILSVR